MNRRPVRRGSFAPRARIVPAALAGLLAVAGCATYSVQNRSLRTDLVSGNFATALETVEQNRSGRSRLLYVARAGPAPALRRSLAGEQRRLRAGRGDRGRSLHEERLAARAVTAHERRGRGLPRRAVRTGDGAVLPRAQLRLASVTGRGRWSRRARPACCCASTPSRTSAVSASWTPTATRRPTTCSATTPSFTIFSALLYEWDGDVNDAFIAYRNAADAWHAEAGRLQTQAPPWLGADLSRTAGRLGFTAELAQAREAFPELFPAADSTAAAGATALRPRRSSPAATSWCCSSSASRRRRRSGR